MSKTWGGQWWRLHADLFVCLLAMITLAKKIQIIFIGHQPFSEVHFYLFSQLIDGYFILFLYQFSMHALKQY